MSFVYSISCKPCPEFQPVPHPKSLPKKGGTCFPFPCWGGEPDGRTLHDITIVMANKVLIVSDAADGEAERFEEVVHVAASTIEDQVPAVRPTALHTTPAVTK